MIIKKTEQGNHVWEYLDDKTRKCELILSFPEYGCPAIIGRLTHKNLHYLKLINVNVVYTFKGKEEKSLLDAYAFGFDTEGKKYMDLADKLATSLANIIMMEMDIIKYCSRVGDILNKNNEDKTEAEELVTTINQEVDNLKFRKGMHAEIKNDTAKQIKDLQSLFNGLKTLASDISTLNSREAYDIYNAIKDDCVIELATYVEYQAKLQELALTEEKMYIKVSKNLKEINASKSSIPENVSNLEPGEPDRSSEVIEQPRELSFEELYLHIQEVNHCILLLEPPEWKIPPELIELARKNSAATIAALGACVQVNGQVPENWQSEILPMEEAIEKHQASLKLLSEDCDKLDKDVQLGMIKLDSFEVRVRSLSRQLLELKYSAIYKVIDPTSALTYSEDSALFKFEIISNAFNVFNIHKITDAAERDAIESIKKTMSEKIGEVCKVGKRNRQCASAIAQQKQKHLNISDKFYRIEAEISNRKKAKLKVDLALPDFLKPAEIKEKEPNNALVFDPRSRAVFTSDQSHEQKPPISLSDKPVFFKPAPVAVKNLSKEVLYVQLKQIENEFVEQDDVCRAMKKKIDRNSGDTSDKLFDDYERATQFLKEIKSKHDEYREAYTAKCGVNSYLLLSEIFPERFNISLKKTETSCFNKCVVQ